jgi:hypothetical protein
MANAASTSPAAPPVTVLEKHKHVRRQIIGKCNAKKYVYVPFLDEIIGLPLFGRRITHTLED